MELAILWILCEIYPAFHQSHQIVRVHQYAIDSITTMYHVRNVQLCHQEAQQPKGVSNGCHDLEMCSSIWLRSAVDNVDWVTNDYTATTPWQAAAWYLAACLFSQWLTPRTWSTPFSMVICCRMQNCSWQCNTAQSVGPWAHQHSHHHQPLLTWQTW